MAIDTSPLPKGLLTDDALPLYGRTANRLWDDLVAGAAAPGDRLPSERVLSARYEVSRVTLRSALAELERRGLVRSAQAKGWYVEQPATAGEAPPRARHSVQGFSDYAAAHGLRTAAQVLRSEVRPATVAEAEQLRIGPGADVFDLRRLRFLDGQVVALEHNRLPLALCPALATTDFGSASLYATLRSATPAQVPGIADYSVEARQPDDVESRVLQIDAAVPLLVATQLTFNQEKRPMELTVQAYRGDRYRFRGSITD